MPEGSTEAELEQKLRQEAQEKFPGDIQQQDKYVFGTIANMRRKKLLPAAHLRSNIPPSTRVKARKLFQK